MLKYPGEWKFEEFEFGISKDAVDEFYELLLKIADADSGLVESFKTSFGYRGTSSNLFFAEHDLRSAMMSKAENAAIFVDDVWSCIEEASERNIDIPSVATLNKILDKHGILLSIDPPNLRRKVGGAKIVDSSVVTSGQLVSQGIQMWTLGQQIGNGGYGVVYRATRTTAIAEFEFAMKILDPSPFINNYEKAVQRFKREVEVICSLQHRAIIQYFEAGVTADQKPYLVMPLIRGKNIRDAASSMPLRGLISLFVELTGALAYAHKKNVLHRDLKPSNIFVRDSDGQVIILDFGSAYLLDQIDSQTLTTQAVGTIGYIPSEILADPSIRSPRHDVYACGVMLYEAVLRRRPDPADYHPLASLHADYASLDSLVRRAIESASRRISMDELHQELVHLAANS